MAYETGLAILGALAACALAFALGRRSARRGVASRELPLSAGREDRPLATAAHEMRTPLSGVMGAAELLLESGLSPEQRTYARAIHSSAGSMLALADRLLGLARLEAEGADLAAETIDLRAFVEEIAELLATRAQAKGLDFAAFVADGAPGEIVSDAARLRQILVNLAGNAIKFTETGGVGLRVELVETGVRFAVVDTGPGFDPKTAERLFEAFERGGEAGAEGAGLGLAISRRLAEELGGELSASAESGVGATFSLTLPCWGSDRAEAERPLSGARVAVLSKAPFSGPWLVEGAAAEGGAATLVDPDKLRADPAGALAAFRPELVVIDRGAGDRAALAALARECGAQRVFLMLAPAERKDLATLKADGFDGYLVKPLRAAALVGRLAPTHGADAAPPPAMAFPTAGGLKVLVAEDDPVSALIALAHLTRLGHASVHVADGEAAVAAFEEGAFDAVLLDMRMPRLDGRAAAARMRIVEAAQGRAPALIVALTAEASGELAEAGSDGVDQMLSKPLDRRALEALLAIRVPASAIAG